MWVCACVWGYGGIENCSGLGGSGIEMDGAVVGQVCGGHDEQIAVNVSAAPQYLLPNFSYSQAKHYH